MTGTTEKAWGHIEHVSVELLASQLHNGVPPSAVAGILERFRDRFSLDECDAEGWNILHYAAYEGHEELVYDLVARFGADVNGGPPQTWTPIAAAARKGHKGIVQTLLDLGADWRMPDAAGWQPIHYAMIEGHKEIIALLRRRIGFQICKVE